jgi:hypothetical protein
LKTRRSEPGSAKRGQLATPGKTRAAAEPVADESADVDAVLDKISAHGINSLTTRERAILEAARKKMAQP